MTPTDIVPMLLQACPSAQEAWDEHVNWWRGEPAGSYNDTGVFVDHIVESFRCGRVSEMPAFFDLVERMIVEGDDRTVPLATIGVLETIQIVVSHERFDRSVFEPWLGIKSREHWSQIAAAWQGVGSLADMIRKERS